MCHMQFFLGGRDLEMRTIHDLIAAHAPDALHDKGLAWGARASHYREEILACLARGCLAVLVELAYDLDRPDPRIVLVDHHGRRADGPTALEQVFHLLDLPETAWSRWHALVAANDAGYIPALVALGASREEIIQVRAADRRAQGIGVDMEAAGEEALRGLKTRCGGALTVACLPHGRTAVLTDRLEPALGGPGYENLLVISPREFNFYGAPRWVSKLDAHFPGGWTGGASPDRKFWGHVKEGAVTEQKLLEVLEKWLNAP